MKFSHNNLLFLLRTLIEMTNARMSGSKNNNEHKKYSKALKHLQDAEIEMEGL